MTLDPYYSTRFAGIRDVTWEALYGGDAVAIEKALAFSQPVGTYQPPPVEIHDSVIPGGDAEIPVRVYQRSPARACLVWLHGGAFKWGDLDMREAHAVAAEIAFRMDVVVVSVDYRLAPTFRYPAPLDDCVAATRWAAQHFQVPDGRIAVGGASAGANLATATCLRLRDEGGPTPRSVCLAYPAVHREIPVASQEVARLAAQLPPLARFTPAQREEIYRDYLGAAYDDPPAYGVPAIADLRGLPPFAIANAAYDDFRPSGETFAEQLRAAGVAVTSWTEPGTAHGFLNETGLVPGALATIERFVAHLQTTIYQEDGAVPG
jgi:acetyl esterase/lipase